MKQLGNLAMVCAKRNDTVFWIINGNVTIHIGQGSEREVLSADWQDDEKITEFIMELNHGRLTEENLNKGDVAA